MSASSPKIKTSVGIILCRKNRSNNRIETLLVKKRYTYAFSDFVQGKYNRMRTESGAHISSLFNNMTREELLDILSLNFTQMWYRVWLGINSLELFNKRQAKFLSSFIREDSGEYLKKLLLRAYANETLLWEVPKGRHSTTRESDIFCAIRELYEETNIDKSRYYFVPGAKRIVDYVSDGVRYHCIYYIAIMHPNVSYKVSPTLHNYMSEVGEIKWHDIEQIRAIDGPKKRLETLIAPAIKLVKKYANF